MRGVPRRRFAPRLCCLSDSIGSSPVVAAAPLHGIRAMINQPHPPSAEEVNRRLVEQYTEIATLAGGLAHEIKNPLSTICLNMELLAEDFAASETPLARRATAKIAVVQQECQRLQNLLDNFLNFAKVRTVRFEAADLNQEVTRVLEFFGPKARESHIEVTAYLDPELPSVVLDREAFHGALINLVLNAQQAMPSGGQLLVRTNRQPPVSCSI